MFWQNVLISSAGRRIQLIECFRDAAVQLGVELRIVAVDANPEQSAACFRADVAYRVSPCEKPGFIGELIDICITERIRLVIPTIDAELLVLSENVDVFARIGCIISVSTPEVVRLARDKLSTAMHLSAHGVSTPRTMSIAEYEKSPELVRWPIIAKPRGGSSSTGVITPSSREELVRVRELDYVVQELWLGVEYTVNMFFDKAGALRCAVPHRRIEVRGGEVSKARTENVEILRKVAAAVGSSLVGARGVMCFQAIVNGDGSYAVLEINARFGGGYPLSHRAGGRFAQWLLEEGLGLNCTARDVWNAEVTMLRYDAAVFYGP